MRTLITTSVTVALSCSAFMTEIVPHPPQTDPDEYADYQDDHVEDYNFLIQGGYRPPGHTLVKHLVSIRSARYIQMFGDNHFCAGSIIAPTLILTAAHCVSRPAMNLRVVAGTSHRLLRTSTTREIKVLSVAKHVQFNHTGTLENDIAIMQLEERLIEDGTTIQRIQLPDHSPLPGTVCTAIGWGTLVFRGPLPDDALYVDIEIWPQPKCKLRVPRWRPGMMCVTDPRSYDKDTCSGDSGGPLICSGQVAGITSWGIKCGGRTPSVYTNVSHYLNWIASYAAPKSLKSAAPAVLQQKSKREGAFIGSLIIEIHETSMCLFCSALLMWLCI